MTLENAKAVHDGYNCIKFCDRVLISLDPPVSGDENDYDRFLDMGLHRASEAGALAQIVSSLDKAPKHIRERVELLTQEIRSLMIQDFTEIREAAIAQLEAR